MILLICYSFKKIALSTLIDIPASMQYLAKVDSGVRDLTEDEKHLEECGLRDGATVAVEHLVLSTDKGRRPISLAKRAFDEAEDQMILTFINKITDSTKVVECSPEETLGELKVRLFDLFELEQQNLTPRNLVICWLDDDGEAGSALYDDNRSLRGHSLSDGGGYILTSTDEVAQKLVNFNFILRLKSDSIETVQGIRNTNEYSLSLPMNTTLLSTKEHMASLLDKLLPGQIAGLSFRLRRTNWQKELLAVYQDESKTLDDCEIYDGTIICLEEGRVPQPGDITFYVQLYQHLSPEQAIPQIDAALQRHQEQLLKVQQVTEKPSSSTSSEEPSTLSSQQSVEQSVEQPASSSASTPEVPSPLVPIEVYSPSLFRFKKFIEPEDIPESIFFHGFLPITMNRSQPLSDLATEYLRVMQTGIFPLDFMFGMTSEETLGDPRWDNHITREIVMAMDPEHTLRFWSGSKLLRPSSLKSAGIGNLSLVTAEIVPRGPALKATELLLFVYLFVPASHDGKGAAPGTFVSLGEIVFAAPKHDFKSLQAQLALRAEARLRQPPSDLQIAKYFFNQKKWLRLKETMDDPKKYPALDTLPEKARAGELRRRENARMSLRENQTKLASGDVVVIYEPKADPPRDLESYFDAFLAFPGIPQKRDPKRNDLRDSYERWGFQGSIPSGRNTVEQGVFIVVDDEEF